LHRSATEEALAAAGSRLDRLTMPTLVIWGERDPWFPVELAADYGRRLPRAEVEVVADAGHWPWLERGEVAEEIAAFVTR